MSEELQQTFDRTVEEGVYRINRSTQSLLATGLVGGLDVAMGVFALLVVREETNSEVAGALAFTIGFIALTLANSELFTENFLVPIAAVTAGRASVGTLLRLWFGTAVIEPAGRLGIKPPVLGRHPNQRDNTGDTTTQYSPGSRRPA